jgi:thioredoxin-related protein
MYSRLKPLKYLLLLLPLHIFAQSKIEIIPVFDQPSAKYVSIEKAILHIRELKAISSIQYGKAVDFYFHKIVKTGKNEWIEQLEEFTLDPDCPAKNRSKINEYILRIRSLQIGEKAPEIIIGNFRLSNFKSKKHSILILFYSPSCFHCTELLIDLIPYTIKINLPVIALQIDEDMNPFVFPENWISIKADAEIRKIYGVISTPSLFLMNSKTKRISSIPENLSEIKKSEHLF